MHCASPAAGRYTARKARNKHDRRVLFAVPRAPRRARLAAVRRF
jgi:hypothetical protein